jgi:hypothetical protein
LVGGPVAFALLSPAAASACVVTWGETITHVADVAPQHRQNLGPNKVGYKWGYWGLLWVDLWTHGGTYCVYEGKRYNPIQPAEAARLLGTNEPEMRAPFGSRVPLGWLIGGPLIVIWITCYIAMKWIYFW